MKDSLRFFLRAFLVITVLFAITLLTACGGTPCNHKDANDDFLCDICGEEYEDGKDACVHRDENDDYVCDVCGDKHDDGPDKPDDNGGSSDGGDNGGSSGGGDTGNLADMSLVDVNKFHFGFELDTVDFMREAYKVEESEKL